MIKSIEIRKAIQAFLKSKHPRVYFEAASDKATYPYLVFDLPNSFTPDESSETFVLEIDGWDAPADGDTTALETLMSNVDDSSEDRDGLHRKVILISGMAMIFYRESKIPLKDDNKLIRRRKYVYQIRTYAGG